MSQTSDINPPPPMASPTEAVVSAAKAAKAWHGMVNASAWFEKILVKWGYACHITLW